MALPLSYNWRNLFVRKLSTLLTFTVVAVIVLVLIVLLSFAAGIHESLAASGSPLNIIVLRPGAQAESTSYILPNEMPPIQQAPSIARDDNGRLLFSPELSVQTSIPRLGSGGLMANVAVRGVDNVAFAVHDMIHVIEGTPFRQGQLEVIVGKAARERFAGLDIGSEVPMGRTANRAFRVVGVFEAGGSSYESEIWAPRTILSDVYRRDFVTSAVLRAETADVIPKALAYIEGPSVRMKAKTETDYYADLSQKMTQLIILSMILVGIMSIGAVFAVANTMYAAVDGRRREIAMLRTIGFSPQAIMVSFVVESLLICGLACGAGLLASLLLNGQRQDYLSDTTWTVLAYELRITPPVVAAAVGLALMVGVFGALAPAVRASRTRLLDALRKA